MEARYWGENSDATMGSAPYIWSGLIGKKLLVRIRPLLGTARRARERRLACLRSTLFWIIASMVMAGVGPRPRLQKPNSHEQFPQSLVGLAIRRAARDSQ